HLVEFPQQRHLVTEPVIEPVAQLIGEKQHDRDDGAGHVRRQCRWRNRTEGRNQSRNDPVRDELIGQHPPAEHHAVYEHVEKQIADIGLVRAAAQDAFGKERAQGCSCPYGTAPAQGLPDKERRGNQQRTGKRGQRKMRTRRDQELAKLTEDKCDSGREIQREAPSRHAGMSYRAVNIALGVFGKIALSASKKRGSSAITAASRRIPGAVRCSLWRTGTLPSPS